MPDTSIEPAGLGPPDGGPTFGFKSRERIEDRTTRKPMSLWDRVKILVLLASLFLFFVLAESGDNPILPLSEAFRHQLEAKWWMAALAAIEIVRQIHYLVSERSTRYHRFWTMQVFGNMERRKSRMNDWNRYRMGRVLRFAFMLVLLAFVLGALLGTSPIQGLVQLPNTIWDALPLIF